MSDLNLLSTVKLYDQFPYETQFEATVVAVKNEKGAVQVALNQTLFFPLEGGQVCDLGTIMDFKVSDVVIQSFKEEEGIREVIWHTLMAEENALLPEVGSRVSCIIDWERRYDLMKQHTGEHILSGLIYQKYGYENVGFHLTTDLVTVDTSGPLAKEDLKELEIAVNEVIAKQIPVEARYVDKEELKNLSYRSKKELAGDVRIVSMEGVDACACCAPHVKNTAEVGMLKIVKAENYKGGVRMEIKCGRRALLEAQENQEILEGLIAKFSCKKEQIPEAIEKLSKEAYETKGALSQLQKDIVMGKAAKLERASRHILFEKDLDKNTHKVYTNEVSNKVTEFVAVFNEDSFNPGEFRYLVIGVFMDARMVQDALKEAFEVKGGGSDKMVQGSVRATRKELEAVLQRLS